MTDLLAVAREEGVGRRWEWLRWVVVRAIHTPWAVWTSVGGGMPYLTRSISKDPTMASSQVTWDQRASSLALVSEEGIGLEHLECITNGHLLFVMGALILQRAQKCEVRQVTKDVVKSEV